MKEFRNHLGLIAVTWAITGFMFACGFIQAGILWINTHVNLPPEIPNPYFLGMLFTLVVLIINRAGGPRRKSDYTRAEMAVDWFLVLAWPGALMAVLVAAIDGVPLRKPEVH